ncbi:hypothetical protein MOMA_03745 [Moraxella macacae 0408225]|uniref:LysM domain-containing protein n=1 Tax=Moraxella macacae 0408225 TaxID=1230338 RepID=L2F996_9GAMM|nr:hypothetical protein [Moraxella macacae]ELA09485.1 hypothetical protein MOMA_03745 [Moraxella macacae 0408225]
MSWQKRSIKLILGLPLSLPIISYAVNIGDTYVQSQQNQPLNAIINVTDIDPANFSVKIANPDAYRQLGLSKDTDINVRFEATSSNGGKIIMTTKQPVASPFTDVVLDINSKGEIKTLPKTLLMPIDNSQSIITQSNTSLVELEPAPIVVVQNNQIELPKTSEPEITEEPIIEATTTEPLVENTLNEQQTQHLTVEETRRIYPVGAIPTPLPPLTEQPLDTMQALEKEPVSDTSEQSQAESEITASDDTKTDDTVTDDDTVTYVIQRNDNLWTIAKQLAKQNNKSISDVMQEIIATNPKAFANNNPNKLQINTKLEIPKYQVMPSQIGVKSANEARQTAKKQTNEAKSGKQTDYKASKPKRTATTVKKQTVKPPTPTTHKQEMQIIAPSQTAGSVAVQDSNKSSNQESKSVVNQVQQKRKITAQKASKVSSLNQSLVDAEQRLKMQNAKLAQLEQRLKELNKN